MNNKTKKIIAREFLILLICIAIAIVTFLTIYPYNYFNRNHIDNLTNNISAKKLFADSLSKSYKLKTEKQFLVTEKVNSMLDKTKFKNYTNVELWNDLYKIAKSDSIKYKWENKWDKELIAINKEMGFSTPESFQSFILTTTINSNDIELNKMAAKINLDADELQSQINQTFQRILSLKNQLNISGLAFIIAVIFLFLFRYIYYGIKWSIKTLKQSPS